MLVDTMASLKGRVSIAIFVDFFNKLQWTADNLRNMLAWWEHRHDDNVLILFFEDLKEDHEGYVRRIAKFMGIDCDEETIARVVHTTTHAEMAKHHSKFDLHSMVSVLAKGIAGDTPPTTLTGRVHRWCRRNGCPPGKSVPPDIRS